MMFIDDVLKFKSLSIVGMEKNTGKTETLNFIIQELQKRQKKGAVTSIGIDGENIDFVTHTHKPEIYLPENSIFVTSEKHYNERRLTSEILNVSQRKTALGRLITAQVKMSGKVILSGPSTVSWLHETIRNLSLYHPDIVIVDGALSRKSFGSPAVTDAMILTTGAAFSTHLPRLISETKFTCKLITLEQFETPHSEILMNFENGIYAIDDEGEIHDLQIPSSLLLQQYKDRLFKFGHTIFVSGVVTDKMLEILRMQKEISDTLLVVKDFTKIYASKEMVNAFLKRGGRIRVLLKTELIAVCINPLSPSGYIMNSSHLRELLAEELQMPVYDIKQIQNSDL